MLWGLLISSARPAQPLGSSLRNGTKAQTFAAKGVVKEFKSDGKTIVIQHEAISNYMDAMTMPFTVHVNQELAGLRVGDEITFRLLLTDSESWIDRISKTGRFQLERSPAALPATPEAPPSRARHPLLDCKFTNELGQAVSLGDFRGQALAITFFFTRCPIPDYCPRLSKNFEQASRKLLALTNAPGNWHFLSVSFDTESDTPALLKAYGERYHYDPRHWSFLTGPPDKIAGLAAQSDVKFERDSAFFNHNFRTLIIDAAGHLQLSFPIGGDLSDAIVAEILKAAAVTNNSAVNKGD